MYLLRNPIISPIILNTTTTNVNGNNTHTEESHISSVDSTAFLTGIGGEGEAEDDNVNDNDDYDDDCDDGNKPLTKSALYSQGNVYTKHFTHKEHDSSGIIDIHASPSDVISQLKDNGTLVYPLVYTSERWEEKQQYSNINGTKLGKKDLHPVFHKNIYKIETALPPSLIAQTIGLTLPPSSSDTLTHGQSPITTTVIVNEHGQTFSPIPLKVLENDDLPSARTYLDDEASRVLYQQIQLLQSYNHQQIPLSTSPVTLSEQVSGDVSIGGSNTAAGGNATIGATAGGTGDATGDVEGGGLSAEEVAIEQERLLLEKEEREIATRNNLKLLMKTNKYFKQKLHNTLLQSQSHNSNSMSGQRLENSQEGSGQSHSQDEGPVGSSHGLGLGLGLISTGNGVGASTSTLRRVVDVYPPRKKIIHTGGATVSTAVSGTTKGSGALTTGTGVTPKKIQKGASTSSIDLTILPGNGTSNIASARRDHRDDNNDDKSHFSGSTSSTSRVGSLIVYESYASELDEK